MTGAGQALKEAREAKGLTLYDVEDKTKIQTRYLKAIEDGRWDILPGHFYTRAFIRTYAEFLGLDPHPFLVQLEDEEDEMALGEMSSYQPLSRRAARDDGPSFSLGKWFSRGLLILFLVLVVAVIWTAINSASLGLKDELTQKAPTDNSTNANQDVEPPVPPGAEDEAEVEEVEPEVSVTKIREEGSSLFYEVSGADTVEVELTANDRVWFEAREGDESGDILASKEIDAGTTETFSSDEGIYIRIGNTSGVTLKVNEETIPTDYAQPRNFIFQFKDTQ